MSVEMRILTCRLLEKMKVYEVYGRRLGLEDASRIYVAGIGGKLAEKNTKDLAKRG